MKVKGGKYTGQGDGSKRAFGKDEGRWQRVPVKFLYINALSLGNKQEAEVQCMWMQNWDMNAIIEMGAAHMSGVLWWIDGWIQAS